MPPKKTGSVLDLFSRYCPKGIERRMSMAPGPFITFLMSSKEKDETDNNKMGKLILGWMPSCSRVILDDNDYYDDIEIRTSTIGKSVCYTIMLVSTPSTI